MNYLVWSRVLVTVDIELKTTISIVTFSSLGFPEESSWKKEGDY